MAVKQEWAESDMVAYEFGKSFYFNVLAMGHTRLSRSPD
jgi:hypothetical protein